jgi:hypothetical protein
MTNVYKQPLALIGVDGITLGVGAHGRREDGVCAMEAVAWIAGEPHSDSPRCASPAISAFMRSWNDSLPDGDRDRLLKPYLAKLIGSRGTKAAEGRRGWLAMDWLIRTFAPAWLSLVHDLSPHAEALRNLPEIANSAAVALAKDPIAAAYSAADSAAYSAAYSAADWAAYSAAYSAADCAARSAADSAAYSAAYSAARSAADSAARSAARSALEPTTKALQASALELLDRMLAVK